MEVLAVTIFFSLLLAVFFMVMFLGSQRNRHLTCEQEALLPLDDDFKPKCPEPSVQPQSK